MVDVFTIFGIEPEPPETLEEAHERCKTHVIRSVAGDVSKRKRAKKILETLGYEMISKIDSRAKVAEFLECLKDEGITPNG